MDELRSTTMPLAKYLYGTLIIFCYFCSNYTYAAFPMERDVAELAGISPHKLWAVFMKKIASRCFDEIKRNFSNSLTDAMWCMTKKHTFECVYYFYNRYCKLIHTNPNILEYDFATSRPHIRVVVHRLFSINITILELKKNTQVLFENKENMYIYMGPLYLFTLMSADNSIKLAFNGIHSSIIEYSVVQRFKVTRFHQMRRAAMYFRWGDFLITSFRIKIDIITRLILDVTSCLRCKILVYDGPNERLPIIMKLNNTAHVQKVVASTFQVFIIVLEIQQQQETLTYAPVYKSTALFNLSNNENQELNFNNGTYCKGHSMLSRLCVYTFYTYNGKTIRFSLTDLQFTGDYQYTRFAAGIVLFNYFHGKRQRMFDLKKNLSRNLASYVDVIGTGSKMDVVVFVYSDFVHLALKFVMSMTSCNILSVHNEYISYTKYISPSNHMGRVFEIDKSAQELFQSHGCFRMQSIKSKYSFQFLFPKIMPSLLTTMPTLRRDRRNACSIVKASPNYYFYSFYNNCPIEIGIIESIKINCTGKYNDIQTVDIKWLPCKVPCACLSRSSCPRAEMMSRRPNDNNTCDICKSIHIIGSTFGYKFKPNISIQIRMKSNVCSSSFKLRIKGNNLTGFASPLFKIVFTKNDIVYGIPDFKSSVCMSIEYTSYKCPLEFPLAAAQSSSASGFTGGIGVQKTVETAYWSGFLYRGFSRNPPESWNSAAKLCQQAGLHLLTIHSADEYHFIKETFLQPYDTLILHIGFKGEVVYLHKVYKLWLNPQVYIKWLWKWFDIFCIISAQFQWQHISCYFISKADENVYMWSGPRFNKKMTSYQYRKSHCGDKTILRPSYLHNEISYTGKMTSLYWIKQDLFVADQLFVVFIGL